MNKCAEVVEKNQAKRSNMPFYRNGKPQALTPFMGVSKQECENPPYRILHRLLFTVEF